MEARIRSLHTRTLLVAITASASAVTSLPAAAQVVQSKLLPPDPNPGAQFGEAVALIPGWAFAGAPSDDEVVVHSGAVYVHQQVGDGWVFAQKLKSPARDVEAFGHAVAAWDEWMVATAPTDDLGLGQGAKGSAQVYRLVNGTWTHDQQVVPSDFASGGTDTFGFGDVSVAIANGVMVVGEMFADFKASNAGAAYVFELQGSSWVETAKLTASDWLVTGVFGKSTATDGATIVVGASRHSGAPTSDQGCAYVFERFGGVWTQTQKLVASDPADQNFFGTSVAVHGDTILVGAVFHQHAPGFLKQGSAYVFTRQGGSWIETQELIPSDAHMNQLFGSVVMVQDEFAVVSARGDNKMGAANFFRRVGSNWTQLGKMLAPDGAPNEVLGYAADLTGTSVLLGAHGDDAGCDEQWNCNTGSAYVFELAPDTRQYGHCLSAGICGNSDDHGGCKNSTVNGGVLAAGGTTSVNEDSLRVEARWLPQNVLGILFMGSATNWSPFGDGRLALGPGSTGVFRFVPPKSSGPGGALIWDGGLVAQSQTLAPAGHTDPGETWYFQTWYRDPTGPCGSGFNVSNGLQVDFTP
jgi:hypothetical protein